MEYIYIYIYIYIYYTIQNIGLLPFFESKGALNCPKVTVKTWCYIRFQFQINVVRLNFLVIKES